ncbi:MAG TPA: glucose-6-phosphate dehydrogenase [Gemmataceae bacterium]|nr:glucose-6-phosphate dehydrogenase [Gemmataceae bacterium]
MTTTLVIFGATGDLTARKLAPSLFRLAKKGRLPPELKILGSARSPMPDDAFRDRLAAAVKEFAKNDWDEAKWREFAKRLFYASGDAAKPGGLDGVKAWLEKAEGGRGGKRLFYFAVSPTLYADIARQLGADGLNRQQGENWTRIVVEKPFGRDLASARDLNRVLNGIFAEDQIYRIDHYLGKDTVQNVLVFRFANTLFEPVWNYNFIDHVQVTVSETVQMEGRGDYYDKSGVLRDMFQNHLLQLLALTAMEAPARFLADPLRNEKVKVLDAIPVLTPEEAAKRMVAGQYAGYRSEKGVAPNSRTPTFAAIELTVENWRWRNVPFFLRSGKGLKKRRSEVVIQFRCPPHLMFPLPPGATLQCNRLTMTIQPDEGIDLTFESKAPDDGDVQLRPTDLRFRYKDAYPNAPLPEAYERLLMDAVAGDAHLFMRSDEIERAWEIIDPFIAAIENGIVKPEDYPVGSEGPHCCDKYLAPMGRTWLPVGREQ